MKVLDTRKDVLGKHMEVSLQFNVGREGQGGCGYPGEASSDFACAEASPAPGTRIPRHDTRNPNPGI